MKMSFELHSRGLCSETTCHDCFLVWPIFTISSLTEKSVYKKKQKNITFNENNIRDRTYTNKYTFQKLTVHKHNMLLYYLVTKNNKKTIQLLYLYNYKTTRE